MFSIARNLIMPRGLIFGLTGLLLLLALMQAGIAEVVDSFTKVAKDTICMPQELTKKDGRVILKVDCNGKSGRVEDADIILEYTKNSAFSLLCTLYKTEKASCKTRS